MTRFRTHSPYRSILAVLFAFGAVQGIWENQAAGAERVIRTAAADRVFAREVTPVAYEPDYYAARPVAAPGVFGFVPRHEEQATRGLNNGEEGEPGTEPEHFEGDMHAERMPIDDGTWGGADSWPGGDLPYSGSEWLSRFGLDPDSQLQILAGASSFTGPTNRGGSGSFGFYEGVNYGAPVPLLFGEIGWQLGMRATQSSLSGASFTPDSRHQTFVTAALFHRVDSGLQWGVGVDWMHESWYYSADFTQLRGELSWKLDCQHELGFFAARGLGDQLVTSSIRTPVRTTVGETYRPTDWYTMFYRYNVGECQDGYVRLLVGCTGEGDGMLGGDVQVPFADSWTAIAGFAYLVPEQSGTFGLNAGHAQESWNVTLGVAWSPRASSRGSYYRPLFNVADNGTFFVDRK